MPLRAWLARSTVQPGAPGFHALTVSVDDWRPVLQDLAAASARLITLWATQDEPGALIRAAFLTDHRGFLVTLPLENTHAVYPGLDDLFPAAARLQRALTDLSGIRCTAWDTRPWLRHASWPQGYIPLAAPHERVDVGEPKIDRYDFVRVEG